MKTSFLFPRQCKKLGWLLFLPALAFSILIPLFSIETENYLKMTVFAISDNELLASNSYFTFIKDSIVDELLLFCLVVGGILIGFSRLKNEDEFISKIRFESLVWATYLNYGLILFFTVFLYGFTYLNVLFYNTFTLILFFIIRFHYKLYQLKKAANDEE